MSQNKEETIVIESELSDDEPEEKQVSEPKDEEPEQKQESEPEINP